MASCHTMRALLLLSIFACGQAETPIETPTFAMTRFDLGRARPDEATVVQGLNLDDRVSDKDDESTCGKADYTSPGPDFEEGVDNQFGPLIGLAPSDPTVAIAPAIERGDFSLKFDLTGVEDLENDSEVAVDVTVGSPAAVVHFTGEIADGRLTATADRLAFDLPENDADGNEATMAMNLESPRLRMTVTQEGIQDGVLGGSMTVTEAIAGALVLDFAAEDALQLVLGGSADLAIDGEGNCQRISSGFVFEARGN